uniref:wall-associated receptor kinase-like 8 n=1 Tax=Erigeron canadensis TaxID=72917 RepID=UPI001CB9CBAD|nr:wall-associated receptor kinase-like 8 [Erigeron canadensis]
MLSFTASETNTGTSPTSIPETYNLINATGNLPIAKPGCDTSCGDLIVPYPFGIGLNSTCSIGDGFDIYCNTSSKPYKAFFKEAGQNVWIKKISDSTIRTSNLVASTCYYPGGKINNSYNISYDFSHSPYTFSQLNKFTVVGCNDYAWLTSKTHQGSEDQVSTGCMVFCPNLNSQDTSSDECSGNGCCRSSIPRDISYYTTRLGKLMMNSPDDEKNNNSSERCTYAFVGEEDRLLLKYNNGAAGLLDSNSFVKRIEDNVPVVLDWAIGNLSCAEARATPGYACRSNSICVDSVRKSGGYRCQCNEGYEGNPYLHPGCQDINECDYPQIYPCNGDCINTQGSYNCTCSSGYVGNATVPFGIDPLELKGTTVGFVLLGFFLGTIMLVFAIWMSKVIQERKDKKSREQFFKRNGGLLLQQHISNGEDAIEGTRMFCAKELEKATDQYNNNRIVGRGGQGTVYKGMLPNGKIVAVKKSVSVDETQVESFINEVFLLSQISHRNVVKLLGCCLETEVPVLVYEFVSNGDLFQFLHDENYEFPTLWSIRITIATDVAGALAYMHSATSIPIYHRDIKSSNILLDEKFRAKLSDFGISKSVMGDQTHLSTLVKGTYGYLDPEYFQSNQFTEKSDVYSFGIVLVELLTGKKPIYSIGPGESRSLASLILSMDEGLILENIDSRVSDGPKVHLIAVAKLAKRCLNLNGKLRPTMKEVAIELEGIRSSSH